MKIDKLLKRKDRSSFYDDVKNQTKDKVDVARIVRRRNAAKADLDQWRGLLETAYHYAMPGFNAFENYGRGGQVTKGQQYDQDIYDLTLPIAHNRLADKMLMGLTPQGQQWIKFKPGDQFGDVGSPQYQQADQATQDITEQFFKILDRTNFYLAHGEALNDVLISTGVLAINEGTRKQPIKFEAVPASQVMLEGNAEGGVDAVFRDWYQVRVENIKAIWPDANINNLRKEKDDKINLWECAYIDYDAKESERYRYVIMCDNKEVLYESASASWPWVVYRMRKMAGEVRGRGPSLQAFPSAATINQAVGDELLSAAYNANPMYMAASDSAFNQDNIKLRPGSILPVQMVMGQWPIQQFPGGGNINFSALVVNELRQQINDMMFAFPLGGVTAPDRTATESQIRYTENLESFAAMVPRLQNEFFVPMVERCMWIINKVLPETFAGIDEAVRKKMLSLDGEILDLRFETPLMTERGKIKTSNLLQMYNSLAGVIGPEAASAMFNVPELVNRMVENGGVERANVKSTEEIEQIVNAAGAAVAQEAENQGVIPNE